MSDFDLSLLTFAGDGSLHARVESASTYHSGPQSAALQDLGSFAAAHVGASSKESELGIG